MELQKKYLGSRVFIKVLGREVVVSEENKLTLLQHNLRHLFDLNRPSKVEQPIKTEKPKKQKKTKESDNSRPTDSEHSEHRIDPDTDNS